MLITVSDYRSRFPLRRIPQNSTKSAILPKIVVLSVILTVRMLMFQSRFGSSGLNITGGGCGASGSNTVEAKNTVVDVMNTKPQAVL